MDLPLSRHRAELTREEMRRRIDRDLLVAKVCGGFGLGFALVFLAIAWLR